MPIALARRPLTPPAPPRTETRRRLSNRSVAPRATSRARPPVNETTGDRDALADELLLARYRDSGEPRDFAEIFRRYSVRLERYLRRFLGDAALAEDVLQETFLLVHSKCGLYQDGWPARPWLYAIASRRAVDALRRSRRPAVSLDQPVASDGADVSGALVELFAADEPGPLETLQVRERQQWVKQSVGRLPESLRHVLVLGYDQGMSYAEIAEVLHVPIGTVKSRLHTALLRLRDMAERFDRTGRS